MGTPRSPVPSFLNIGRRAFQKAVAAALGASLALTAPGAGVYRAWAATVEAGAPASAPAPAVAGAGPLVPGIEPVLLALDMRARLAMLSASQPQGLDGPALAAALSGEQWKGSGAPHRFSGYALMKALTDPRSLEGLRSFIDRRTSGLEPEARIDLRARLDEWSRRVDENPAAREGLLQASARFEDGLPFPGGTTTDDPWQARAAWDALFNGGPAPVPAVAAELALSPRGRWRAAKSSLALEAADPAAVLPAEFQAELRGLGFSIVVASPGPSAPAAGRGASRAAARDVRLAAQIIRDKGIDLHADRLRILGTAGAKDIAWTIRRGADGAIEVSVPFIERVARAAREQGLPVADKLAHALLAAQLTSGLSEGLRWPGAKLLEAGFGLDQKLSAGRAAAFFKRAWKAGIASPLASLLALSRRAALDPVARMGQPASAMAFDPVSRRLIVLYGHQVKSYGLEGQGAPVAFVARDQEFAEPTQAAHAVVDAESRLLITCSSGGRIELRRLLEDGRVEEKPVSASNHGADAPLSGLAFDPASRTLFVAEKWGVWSATVMPDGSLADRPNRAMATPYPAPVLAFDAETRTLYTAGEGLLEARSVEGDGSVQTTAKQSLPWPRGAGPLWIDGHGSLIAANGRQISFFRLDARGFVDPSPQRSYGASMPVAFAADPRSTRFFFGWRNGVGITAHVSPPSFLEVEAVLGSQAEKESLAGALAETVWAWKGLFWRPVPSAIYKIGDAVLARAFWSSLASAALRVRRSASPIKAVPGSALWFPGMQEMLKRRMPTLWAIIRRPRRLARFLFALSMLRAMHPYNEANAAAEPPLAWAEANGAVYRLNELKITPASESFRRHILYVDDAEGRFAVELKMPGEDRKRNLIREEHFTAAKDLWDHYPDDPGVVKPIAFQRYVGSLRLYSRRIRFPAHMPLGVMLFQYEDGKRLSNVNLSFTEKVFGITEAAAFLDLQAEMIADIAAAIIRLHRLGWSGSLRPDSDLHLENVKLLMNRRAVLGGDFGTFNKETIDMARRSAETLRLIGVRPEVPRLIYPNVISRLVRNVRDESLALELAKDAAVELGLNEEAARLQARLDAKKP